MDNLKNVSTEDLLAAIGQNTATIIDIRSVNAYNGWRLQNENRGGHIKGAKSFPAQWIGIYLWTNIAKNKNILPENNIIIYGYNPEETIRAAEKFLESGFVSVSVYHDFIDVWTASDSLPMENLPRFKHLVSPQWVDDLLKNKKPDEFDNDKYLICHAHYRNRNAYLSGHIPTAIDIDTLALESSKTWNRKSPAEIKEALEQHGITSDTTVILYGKYLNPDIKSEFPGSAAGHIGAIRCGVIMMYAGVKDVRILNGGFRSWKDAGYEISMEDVPKKPVKDFGASIPVRPEIFIDTPQAKEYLASKDSDLVSVRSWEEYIGEESGYNYIEKKGDIPGALFGNCGSDAYHMQNYRNIDFTTKEYHEILKQWMESGISPYKKLAFYCGTGWRASEAFLNAWLMGLNNVSVYDGGWFEWSNDPENPIRTGIPGKQI